MTPYVVAVLAAVGVFFALSGALGIARMPDVYNRIQCSTKTITLGSLPALAAAVVAGHFDTTLVARAVVAAVLLLVLNPVASHALGRAAYKTGIEQTGRAVAAEREESR